MWTLKSNLAVITNPSLISKTWGLTNAKTLFPSIKVAASREHAFKQTFTNTCFKPPSNKRTIWIFFAKILSSIIRRSSQTYNILSIWLLPGMIYSTISGKHFRSRKISILPWPLFRISIKNWKGVWKDQGQSQSVTQGLLLSRGMPIKSRRSFGRAYLIMI